MALIKCPECGKEISSFAPTCIYCGYPLELMKNKPEDQEIPQAKAPEVKPKASSNIRKVIAKDDPLATKTPVKKDTTPVSEAVSTGISITGQDGKYALVMKQCGSYKTDAVKILSDNGLNPQEARTRVYRSYNTGELVALLYSNDEDFLYSVKERLDRIGSKTYVCKTSEFMLDELRYKKKEVTCVEQAPKNTEKKRLFRQDDPPEVDNTPVSCPKCGSTSISTDARGYRFISGFLGSGKTVNRCARCGYTWDPELEYFRQNRRK